MRAAGVDIDDAALWTALWEQCQIGLAVVAPDGRFVSANRTACAFLEYGEAELRRLSYVDVTAPGDVDADREMAEALARHPIGGYDMVKRYVTKSNRIVWASLRVVPLVSIEGQFLAYLSQISPVVPVSGAIEERRRRPSFRWLREYWAQILVALGAVAVVAAQIIERLGDRGHH